MSGVSACAHIGICVSVRVHVHVRVSMCACMWMCTCICTVLFHTNVSTLHIGTFNTHVHMPSLNANK